MVNHQPLTPHIMPTLVIPTSWRSYRTTDSVTSFHPIYLAKLQTRTWLSRALFSAFYRAMLCIRGTSHGPVSVCLSVRESVRPSQVGVLLKRLNVGSHKQQHMIAQGL